MKILGITGGVGSGKSAVLSYLEQKEGIVVYQADKIAREEQEAGTVCFREIVSCFGTEILTTDGQLDRQKLGQLVFADKQKLEQLNKIVHPSVFHRIQELIEQHSKSGTKIFVIEAAILLESNYQEFCHEVWYIYCQEAIRMERLKESRNYTEELFHHISQQQMSEMMFRNHCAVVIDNSYDENHLHQEIERKIEIILGEKAR